VLFNSVHFVLLFFPVVILAYFLLPHRLRWVLLLAASCYFYMAFVPYYILILLFTIAVDYFAGILISSARGRKRKILLACSIVANVGVLAFFKYWNFSTENLNALAHAVDWNYSLSALAIVLPIGLSFHTFQSMSYTIEVYRGQYEAERHPGIFALYVLFFPQLVAGPIERPQNLLPQFRARHSFDYQRVVSGLQLMLWGFFQKMAIADRIAPVVDRIYSDPGHHSGSALAIATVLFAFQILCDFAGYSDIAIGVARVMGFTLMLNFRQPYLARSVSEFWKRWHISLSSWFRDYLYIPLGGGRVRPLRRWLNVMIVFLVSGLWHGANWTFVVWGGLNGLYVVGEDVLGLNRMQRWASARTLLTFALACVAWVFFRAASAPQACMILEKMIRQPGPFRLGEDFGGMMPLASAALLIGLFMVVSVVREKRSVGSLLAAQPAWVRWPLYTASLAGVLLLGAMSSRQFIYFQF
jgi:D-alanyl-lipoteichoic acid acyltransferase DltB (MBOAT superfamily)